MHQIYIIFVTENIKSPCADVVVHGQLELTSNVTLPCYRCCPTLKGHPRTKVVYPKYILLQRICYSHWANGARNGVFSIGQWGVFNHEKGAI